MQMHYVSLKISWSLIPKLWEIPNKIRKIDFYGLQNTSV